MVDRSAGGFDGERSCAVAAFSVAGEKWKRFRPSLNVSEVFFIGVESSDLMLLSLSFDSASGSLRLRLLPALVEGIATGVA